MSYLVSKNVQDWLQNTKYVVTTVNTSFESQASLTVLGKLGRRYDTSTWIDASSTPALVLNVIAMLVASYELRKAASEEDGLTEYADWLEGRATQICEDILEGAIEIGVDPDTTTAVGGSAVFFPTDASTQLATDDPCDPDGTPQMFSMGQVF